MFDRLVTFFKAVINSMLGRMENPQMMLEQTYKDLNDNVLQVRQAVAQAIASEKQLELQLQQNKDNVETWQNRATMAVSKGNDDLARQALQRKQQYMQAVTQLDTQLKTQKQATTSLRQKLTELEAELQKAYTKKQILIARDKAADATTKANEILSKTSASGTLNVIENMENKVLEKELKAQALAEIASDDLDKQFKNYEGRSDIETELLALKKQVSNDPSITIKEPELLENKLGDNRYEDTEVKEISD